MTRRVLLQTVYQCFDSSWLQITYLYTMFVAANQVSLFLIVYSSLATLIGCSPTPVEVMIVAFGSSAPYGVASMAITGPTFEVAVEELGRKYNNSFNFSYTFPGAHSCLSVIKTEDDDLSKWYYRFQAPGRTVIFISPGTENGTFLLLVKKFMR